MYVTIQLNIKEMNIINKEHEYFIMTITQLLVFVEVADHQSFTKAGQVLNMTQPAVSHAISSLEKELDVTLIIRDRKKGILLTDIGKRILVYVREMLNNKDKIEQEVAAYKGLEVGTIRVGSFAAASSYFLPKIIREIQQQYPQLEIVLYEGSIHDVKEWLEQRVVDVAFVVASPPQFETSPLYQDSMVAVIPEDHPLQTKEAIHLQDLKDETLVVCQGGGNLPINEQLAKEGISLKANYFVQQANTALKMIAEGLGIAILPELSLGTLPAKFQKRQLFPHISREIQLATLPLKESSVAVRLFVTITKQLFMNGK
jgi:DNA-binding transcriptional LysR family regulator